jgi:hypothetical protein
MPPRQEEHTEGGTMRESFVNVEAEAEAFSTSQSRMTEYTVRTRLRLVLCHFRQKGSNSHHFEVRLITRFLAQRISEGFQLNITNTMM